MAGVRAAHGDAVSGTGKASPEDWAFAAFDIITLAADARPGNTAPVAYSGNQIGQGVQKGRNAKRGSDKVSVKPNPWFVANGHDEHASPVTQSYLFTRGWKAAAGPVVSGAGGIGKFFGSVINVGSTLRHGSAAATTGLHLYKVRAIAQAYRKSETIARWCEVIIRAKSAKAALRTTQLAGAVIPVPLAGTIINSLAAAGKLGIKIGLPEMCYLAAIEIHWRAFQEQRIANFGTPSAVIVFGAPTGREAMQTAGPASRIFAEIFERRGITTLFGRYDVGALIQEPAGWMALGDKLSRD
jgi:hypothetical protein